MQFIDLKKQFSLIENEVLSGIQRVLEHGQYIMGQEILELEKKLAEFVGCRYAIGCASGTDALLMALLALDIGPGDEVITTPFSFFATAEVIALCGAKPVFVDIDPDTYNINPDQIEAAITSKTRAIMPVSLYGQCANMTKINYIAQQYNLPVIEDGAQSFGATHQGYNSCGLSTIACTSFFPSKPLGGYGDSGACFTDDEKLAQKLLEIRIHGQNVRYSHRRIGINGRMDTIQAAILLEKIKLFPEEVILRKNAAERYNELLPSAVKKQKIEEGNTCVYAQYTIEINDRAGFQEHLQSLNIPTAIHYPIPMHLQEALNYLGYKPGDFPHAEKASNHVISLPMHAYITPEEQKMVASAVQEVLSTYSVMA